jgi:hypothetical protein
MKGRLGLFNIESSGWCCNFPARKAAISLIKLNFDFYLFYFKILNFL